MRNLLYRQLVTFLGEMKNPDHSPVFKHIDLWTEGTGFGHGAPGFKVPGIFIEFAPVDRKGLHRTPETVKDNIRFHIITPWHSPHDTAETTISHQSIDWLGLPEQLCSHLSTFTYEDSAHLSRIRSSCSRRNIRTVEAIEEYTLDIPTHAMPRYVFDDSGDTDGLVMNYD